MLFQCWVSADAGLLWELPISFTHCQKHCQAKHQHCQTQQKQPWKTKTLPGKTKTTLKNKKTCQAKQNKKPSKAETKLTHIYLAPIVVIWNWKSYFRPFLKKMAKVMLLRPKMSFLAWPWWFNHNSNKVYKDGFL